MGDERLAKGALVIRTLGVRAAAVVALLHGIMQAVKAMSWTPGEFIENIVVTTMRGAHVSAFGVRRSYWDFYFGYELTTAGTLIVEAVLLWLVANVAWRNPEAARPILWLLIVANILHAVAQLLWFLPAPVLFDAVVVFLLLWAVLGRGQPARNAGD